MVEENDMKTLQVGIMAREAFQERALKIARGEYKPKKTEPKVWFSSMKSLCEILSENNMSLLRVIHEQSPESIKELSELTNRKQSNLSRTLKTMARYGIVELKKIGKNSIPVAKALDFNISCSAI